MFQKKEIEVEVRHLRIPLNIYVFTERARQLDALLSNFQFMEVSQPPLKSAFLASPFFFFQRNVRTYVNAMEKISTYNIRHVRERNVRSYVNTRDIRRYQRYEYSRKSSATSIFSRLFYPAGRLASYNILASTISAYLCAKA